MIITVASASGMIGMPDLGASNLSANKIHP